MPNPRRKTIRRPGLTNDLQGLAGWLVLAFIAASLGGLGSAGAAGFYQLLRLPPWAPPGWLFGPVWTLLYLMMGTASWLVWRQGGFSGARTALVLYLVQLTVNTLWSWLFFTWQQGAAAFAVIILLWLLIVATLLQFRNHSTLAAGLLVPYLAWVSFAAALAWTTWRDNPQLLG